MIFRIKNRTLPIKIAKTKTPDIHIIHMNIISKILFFPGFGAFPMETAVFNPI